MKIYRKYKALGFVEALMSIAIAGIASIVLMSLAVNVLNQVLRNEMDNELTEKALEGATMVKKVAANNSISDETLFPKIDGNQGKCYAIEGGTSEPTFSKTLDEFNVACNYDSPGAGGRDACRQVKINEEVFRVFCILSDSVVEKGLVVGKVVTGLSDCDEGNNSGKCKLKDYEYFLGVQTEQKN